MDPVAQIYDKNSEYEWERLARDPYHTLEFTVVMHHVRKHVPPGSDILDAGGGPGRYAIQLCRDAHRVTLLDLSSGCIEAARKKFAGEPETVRSRLPELAVGDVRDLSRFGSDRFDGVLCLDPLSYVIKAAEREQAISELIRVAKPGGIVFIAVRGYLAVLRTILDRFSGDLLKPLFETLLKNGDTDVGGVPCHFFRADEIRKQAECCGLETIEMAGCEGLSSGMIEATNLIGQDAAKWERWTDLIAQTSAEPAVVDMAEHILYIGRVPGD